MFEIPIPKNLSKLPNCLDNHSKKTYREMTYTLSTENLWKISSAYNGSIILRHISGNMNEKLSISRYV